MSERQWEVVKALLVAAATALGTTLVNEAVAKVKAGKEPAKAQRSRAAKKRKRKA